MSESATAYARSFADLVRRATVVEACTAIQKLRTCRASVVCYIHGIRGGFGFAQTYPVFYGVLSSGPITVSSGLGKSEVIAFASSFPVLQSVSNPLRATERACRACLVCPKRAAVPAVAFDRPFNIGRLLA